MFFILKKHIGKEIIVIPETYLDGYLTGHTDNYLKVKFQGCEELIGKTIKVSIEEYKDKILIGKVL